MARATTPPRLRARLAEAALTRTQTIVTLSALWALNFATAVQFLVIAPILPRIQEQLVVPDPWLGTLITAYATAFGVFALIAGPVSDRIGRRAILVWGSAALTLALAAHGLATSFASLLLVRALAGMASGVLSGATVSYVGDAFPYHLRGWANGWLASAFAAGQILGVPLGTILAETGYRTPFLVFAALGFVAWLLILRFVEAPDVELASELSIGSAVRAYRDLLAMPAPRAAVGAYVSMFLGVAVFVTFLPTWLEATFDVSGPQVATLFMVGGLSNLFTGPLAGRLSDRIGRKPLVVVGSVCSGLLMVATPWLVTAWWRAYVLFFLVMIFVALRVSPQQSLVSSLVPARQRGSLMSLCFATGQVGFALGGMLAGLAYGTHWGFFANGALGGAAAVTMATIVALFLPEPDAQTEVTVTA